MFGISISISIRFRKANHLLADPTVKRSEQRTEMVHGIARVWTMETSSSYRDIPKFFVSKTNTHSDKFNLLSRESPKTTDDRWAQLEPQMPRETRQFCIVIEIPNIRQLVIHHEFSYG